MVQSKAQTVDAYIAEASAERAPWLEQVRALARKCLPDHEEAMQYGMPVYRRNGVTEFGFASQKQYLSLYIARPDVLVRNAAALAGLDRGKGCIRYRKPETMDPVLVERLLRDTAVPGEPPC